MEFDFVMVLLKQCSILQIPNNSIVLFEFLVKYRIKYFCSPAFPPLFILSENLLVAFEKA